MQPENALSILVIRSDDTRAHIYRDFKQLLRTTALGAAGGLSAVEFFSTAGHRLAPVFDVEWRLQALVETTEKPQPDLILQRLRTTVRHMRGFLRENEEALQRKGLSLEDGLARLPSLREASLEDALPVWTRVLGHDLGSHSTDPWHNFWVHGIL
jgi:hypothetical protein